MLQITEVTVFSIDKSEESWAIEGEIVFEDDLSSAFEASYLAEEDELEQFSLELDIEENFDLRALKEWVVRAANEFVD